MSDSSLASAWRRRAVTLPAVLGGLALTIVALPVAVGVAALVDAARRTRWAATRSVLFLAWYLACETVGLLACFGLWVCGLARPGSARGVAAHYALEWWWARRLMAGATRLFGLRLEVEGADVLPKGPLLVFMRHASVGDTLLPAVLLSSRHGLRLRYVMKRELLWDPCLDIVGNRLPNLFVDRASRDSAREARAVGALAEGLGEGEGVLIYPEGTRFTPARRARMLADPALAARAERLEWVLPPRTGGPIALLERSPGTDVVFCAHAGFEGTATFGDLWSGALVGARVRIRFWRVAAGEIPMEKEARIAWLFAWWERIDVWLRDKRGQKPS